MERLKFTREFKVAPARLVAESGKVSPAGCTDRTVDATRDFACKAKAAAAV